MTFKPRNILVPVAVGPSDDKLLAEQLVDAACDLVKGTADARLSLVYVNAHSNTGLAVDTGFAPPSYYEAMAKLWETNREAAILALGELKRRAEKNGVSTSVEILEPIEGTGEAIAHAAAAKNADLIAIWSHARRGLKRLFLGSVAERVAHMAPVPVLILRAPERA